MVCASLLGNRRASGIVDQVRQRVLRRVSLISSGMGTEAKRAAEGLFSGTRMAFRNMEVLHRPPATVTGFPYGSFPIRTPQPSIFSQGSQAIHGSPVYSESMKVVSNRPLSPNLILKKPQFSATYSISHRIFGAALASAILATPILMKFSVMFDI